MPTRTRLLLLTAALVFWPAGVLPATADVLVSAATSLTDVLTLLATRFEAANGEHVQLNLAASNMLSRQIGAGARVDVFISADEAQMDRIVSDIAPGTRIDLLSNLLAVAVSRGTSSVKTVRDLASASVRRIAIGDPVAVPAGVYAKEYLEKIGLWSSIQAKLVPSGSIRLALVAVESGAADAAIVYATDVPTARNAATAVVVPELEGPRIRYPAAVMKNAPNAAGARRFLSFLQSAEAKSVFRAAGFGVLDDAARPTP